MTEANRTKDHRLPEELIRHYLRPWYAAMSITIYRDIKAMAVELLEHRHDAEYATRARLAAEKMPVTATEAEAIRQEFRQP